MAIRKITFNNMNVSSEDDSYLYYLIFNSSGILKGIKNNCSYSCISNRIIFQSGYVSIYGRLIFIEDSTEISIPLNSTAYGYVVLLVNTGTDEVTLTTEESETEYPTLQQDNLSKGVGIYKFPLVKYTKTTVSLVIDEMFSPNYIYPRLSSNMGAINSSKLLYVTPDGNVGMIPQSSIISGDSNKLGGQLPSYYCYQSIFDTYVKTTAPSTYVAKQEGYSLISNNKLNQIDTNKTNIAQNTNDIALKLNKNQGSSNGNKVLLTDYNGNIIFKDVIPSGNIPETGVSVDSARALELSNGTIVNADNFLTTSSDAYKKIISSFTIPSTYITTNNIRLTLTFNDGTSKYATLPSATTSKAGLMTSGYYNTLNNLNINALKYMSLGSGGFVDIYDGVAIIQIFSTSAKNISLDVFNSDDYREKTFTLSVKGWLQLHFDGYDGSIYAVYCNSSGALATYQNLTGVQDSYIEIGLPSGTLGCALYRN